MATGVVEVGGLHIQNEGQELDESLKKWLDESKSGVIYFFFFFWGSMFRLETLPNRTIEIIFQAFEKVSPVRVLTRLIKPEELIMKLPDNEKTLQWIPQQKVLELV